MFDLDAVIAEEQAGSEPEPFGFMFDKQKYELPGRLDGRAFAASEGGRMDRALRMLAGPEQWAQIEASQKTLTVATMTKLLVAWVAHCNGTTVPKPRRPGRKSPASTGQRKSTAKRSKPTSRGTTKSASLKSVRTT